MIEVKRILKVPPQQGVRNDLRERVRLFVLEHKIVPPLNFGLLEEFATQIHEQAELNGEFIDFSIVLLGNEIWRKYIAAIPFHRRLLLLPQCLRNTKSCQGVFDDLGLICAGCKNCRIDYVLNKAGQLGYTTLVAEGTTMAIGLVEEGAIDAVIGVSCMSVLQRSFGPVTRAALPGIGIPLLNDGCENTTIDYEWLFEEMEQISENPAHRPLSVSSLKNQADRYFQPPVISSFFPDENETEQLALKMMEKGGQRIRPLLAMMAYQAYSDNPVEEVQQALAVSIECFHKASLVHDDIEDDEDSRYGQPVLHKTEGIPAAINVGDYLIGKGYHLLSQMPVDAPLLAECLKVVAISHLKLSEGQGADILLHTRINEKSVEDVVHIFRLKTGEAVKVALLTGAIQGNASVQEKKNIEQFSEFFGIAYQIRDDLSEFRERHNAGHPFDFPFLLAILREKMLNEKAFFSRIIEEKNMTLIRENISIYRIDLLAERYFRDYVEKCYSELDNLQNQKLRLGLYVLMGKVFKNQESGQQEIK